MAIPIFITGIGTGIGKTLASAIITEALEADYWKPVQAGYEITTDASEVSALVSNPRTRIHPECYKLALAASPHIAARAEHLLIDLDVIHQAFGELETDNPYIVVEGAGGLMVPLNDAEFVIDLASRLEAKVILVSRNYLGSINHSLLTAQACKARKLEVLGWLFNDHYGDYEKEIVHWSGYPSLGHIPFAERPDRAFVRQEATLLAPRLKQILK
jgi:dethiobiotin synthetase